MIKRLVFPAVWLGIIATIGQILLLRESLVLFYGNELCIGLMLAGWLLWVALGSFIGSKLSRNPKEIHPLVIASEARQSVLLSLRAKRGNPEMRLLRHFVPRNDKRDAPRNDNIRTFRYSNFEFKYFILLVIINLALPASLLWFRALRIILQVPPGEMFTFSQIAGAIILCQSLFPFSLGLMFGFYCTLVDSAKEVGKIYLYESLGALIGGTVYTFYLVKSFDPFSIWVGLFALSVLAYYTYIREANPKSEYRNPKQIQNPNSEIQNPGEQEIPNKIQNSNSTIEDLDEPINPQSAIRNPQSLPSSFLPPPSIILVLCLIVVLLSVTEVGPKLDKFSTAWRWYKQELIESKDSVYGNIAVTNIVNQKNIYADGTLLFSIPNPIDDETFAHFTLLQHPNPFGKKILLLGGGGGSILREMLKYQPEKLVYLELDPLLLQITRKYLSATDREAMFAKPVQIINQDGRGFLKQTQEKFDLIIVNLTDPKTAMVNRYYTAEFFREVNQKLLPDGVFCIGLIGGEAYLGPELLNLNKTIEQTLRSVFANIVIIPGDRNLYFASNANDIISDNTDYLTTRWNARVKNISTQYFNEYMLEVVVQPDRVEFIKEQLAKVSAVTKNEDFKPTAYFYNLQLWLKQSKGFIKTLFSFLTNIRLYHFVILIGILVVLVILLLKRKSVRQQRVPPITVAASTGLVGITLALVFVYAFQAIYGYVYQWVGLIIAIFMFGLAGGSFLGTKLVDRNPRRKLILAELSIFGFCLLIPFMLNLMKEQESAIFGLPMLTLIIGFMVGFEFPVCVAAYQNQEVRSQRSEVRKETGGLIYASDLLGSAVGALIAAVVLLPLFGILTTVYLMALLKIGSIIILWDADWRR
ncbi:MAG: fused MFS/spermidine synthase [bacterium]|nr:fused MFS/spermidine synthase [bacterium]